MAKKDIPSINYFKDKTRIADLLNVYLYGGNKIISPQDVSELNPILAKSWWNDKKLKTNVNITDVLSKHPYQMSGGQKQRVASARAIVTNPSMVLADEPTGALDSKSARMLLESFRKLNEEMNATILMVTHDAFTASYCKRILFIKDGKLFNELIRGTESRKEFFDRIMEVIALLGGDLNAE